MNRHRFRLTTDVVELKQLAINAAASESTSLFLDSNHHQDRFSMYNWMVALGSHQKIASNESSIKQLKNFRITHNDWLFGHIAYGLKNELESLESRNNQKFGYSNLSFFIPRILFYEQTDGECWAECLDIDDEEKLLEAITVDIRPRSNSPQKLVPQTSEEDYLKNVESIKKELHYGNIYELNYCIEFSSYIENFNSHDVFNRINQKSEAPFSALYHTSELALICASPERYIQKQGDRLVSQPMKGTAKRSMDLKEDELNLQWLKKSKKEQNENVMITDLVRNDLSKTAVPKSVTVSELFGTRTYKQVHQMISTIESRVSPEVGIEEVISTTFPMGSMTGAPKLSAMKIIDQHENFARELYAGSIGYITPLGDFDFNVVIRSIFHDSTTGYTSVRVGSALTLQCDAKQEYEECKLKAKALLETLEE